MADDAGFLHRWSRRKAAARRPPEPPPLPPVPAPATAEPPPPDLALPPIETLGAASDYSVFLQRGVAAELQRQALQRAWSTDATIAGFRGMAEYDWDFNATDYGRLWPVDDVAKLLGEVLAPPEPEPPPPPPDPVAVAAIEPEPDPAPPTPDPAPVPPRRHGSALPS